MSQHRNKIQEAMRRFYNSRIAYADAIEIIKGVEEDLIAVLPDYQAQDNDFRLGSQSYGYSSEELNLSNIYYVSDRWGCAFRIAWLLGLVNENYR